MVRNALLKLEHSKRNSIYFPGYCDHPCAVFKLAWSKLAAGMGAEKSKNTHLKKEQF
jgi:hypothetical protein